MNENKSADVLVIGGGPAGRITALTSRKYYPGKSVILAQSVAKGVVPCGIPYMAASLKSPDDNFSPAAPLAKSGIVVLDAAAEKVDRGARTVSFSGGLSVSYKKLVLACGSTPFMPKIPGAGLKNVFRIYKDLDLLKEMFSVLAAAKSITVLGGGFIGVEMAEELAKAGRKVTLVEMQPALLGNSFDPEFGSLAGERLAAKGVRVLTGAGVEAIEGSGRAERIRLSGGETYASDAVVLAIGALPNAGLAADSGLDISKTGAICVDEYMRTSDPDVFAVGDCAEKKDFFTRRPVSVMLASTATAEARVAGSNLFGLKVVRENKGTIAAYSTCVDGLVLASAGLTEGAALKEGFEIVTGSCEGLDRHPAAMPGASKIKLKLVFSRHSGLLMGGQVSGGVSCGELINIVGAAVQTGMSVSELETLQVATHPWLTSAPTVYPITAAAQDASVKLCRCMEEN
ncbi:MAG: pyridine nucleotide-disulfide oxidoreductase [Elusimicrobia bacterium GWC2_64_44]|nr:MAG: pyridine nucleotide-disulfide oxidoreductase [Elusimicrobia bacterium GWC2_64_44]